MTFNELYVLLKTTGISQKRMKSKTALSPPYLVVCEGEAEYGGADLKVLLKQHNPRIELYTTDADFTSYNTLTQCLINNNISFVATDETPLDDEGIFIRYFDVETQIDKI